MTANTRPAPTVTGHDTCDADASFFAGTIPCPGTHDGNGTCSHANLHHTPRRRDWPAR